ncbi:hypothetical protein P7C65_01s1g00760 [Encephalitozoon intestinalis]
MESSDRRSGSSMSLKKLGMIVVIFFFIMGAGLAFIYKYLGRKDPGAGEPKAEGMFKISMRRGGNSSSSSGGRMSILSMDAKHVQRMFDVILEDINNAREAYSDILQLLKEYENNSQLSERTRKFIKMMLMFLETGAQKESEDLKIIRSVANIILKRLPRK